MLTPQEVSSRVFSKAVVGGYNMAMVDEFLDELTDDYSALYKENAALKAKMKVLVDKVEEYRDTEDSMRTALLTAQKMANSMVEEANMKKSELIAKAESEASEQLLAIRAEIELEKEKLERAKRETAQFLDTVRGLYERELALLDEIPDLPPVEAPRKDEHATQVIADVSEIEAKIMASFAAAEAEGKEEEAERKPSVDDTVIFSDDIDNPFIEIANRTPKLSELKFGRNYRAEE